MTCIFKKAIPVKQLKKQTKKKKSTHYQEESEI